MWTSLGVLVGVALVWTTGITWLDPVVAILAGANILWTAGRLIREAFGGLMERADEGDTARVLECLNAAVEDGRVAGFHHLRHRRVNDVIWIEVHLLLPDALPLDEAHRRATQVESDLSALFPSDRVQLTSHLEPASHEHPEGLRHETAVEDALS
jgi:cation diffusion facilitator family transporter